MLTVLAIVLIGGCGSPTERTSSEPTACLPDGPSSTVDVPGFGAVESRYNGFGCTSFTSFEKKQAIHLRPQVARSANETHAALTLGPETGENVDLSCETTTVSQLRQGSAPNPHEVGWLVWQFKDNDHFYYLTAKTNGWELGKRDPAYPGGQSFLATGWEASLVLGRPCSLRVTQSGPRIEAFVDGQSVAVVNDNERPYTSGRVGFYCEDSDVYFDAMSLKAP